MIAIENAEIGGTLIALSIPGLKPLVNKELSKLRELRRSYQPHTNSLSPSDVFASNISKNTVILSGKVLQPNHSSWLKATASESTVVTNGAFCGPISLVELVIRAQEQEAETG